MLETTHQTAIGEPSARSSTHTRWVVTLLMATTTIGCGGSSQQDMIAARMQRRRSNPDAEPKNASPVVRPVVASTSAKVESTTAGPAKTISPATGESDTTPSSDADAVGVPPITQRRPQRPLSETERRQRSVENLVAIHAAIMQYAEDNQRFPVVKTRTATGFDGLSWRVLILPQLGHEELFRQFDLTKAWDEEPNKSLIHRIPDAFVSPERFDDRTNYVLAVGSDFAFEPQGQTTPDLIEDGIAATVFLLEADDELATPWTKPSDYEPEFNFRDMSKFKDGLGKLRGDGVFAIWGGGKPVLLSNSLRPEVLLKAFKIDDGTPTLPATIHRDIPIDVGGNQASAKSEQSAGETPGDVVEILSTKQSITTSSTEGFEPPANRLPVPSTIDVDRSTLRLRELFEDRLRSINAPAEHAKFAGELLAQASKLQSDPAGMYAMLLMAREHAIASWNETLLLRSIDSIVFQFEVDAYRVNLESLAEYSRASNRETNRTTSSGRKMLGRIVRTMSAAIAENDFAGARGLCRLAARVVSSPRGSELPTRLNQLAVSISEAGSIYGKVADSLAVLRDDPDNEQASATVGRFLCFVKGDWETGLPLLQSEARGAIGEVAARDIAGATTAAEQVAMADAWWSLGEMTDNETYRNGAIDRATHWYTQAFANLPPSLDRMHVQARLQKSRDAVGSPVGLLRGLAEATNVDLSVPLAAVQVRTADGDDDEDD